MPCVRGVGVDLCSAISLIFKVGMFGERMQVGYAYVTPIKFNKAPFVHGHRVVAVDPIAQAQSNVQGIIGNEALVLGTAMGVYDVATLNALPFGERVPMVPGREDWCDSTHVVGMIPPM